MKQSSTVSMLLVTGLFFLGACGPSGVTLIKPSTSLVDYEYVTCSPRKDDPDAVENCIRYYEKQGFLRQSEVNVLQ